MSDGGVSQTYVDSQIGRLERQIGRVAGQVAQLEDDMANVEGAIKSMHHSLAKGLDQLTHSNRELVEIQQSTQTITVEQFVAANTHLNHLRGESAAGFAHTTAGLGNVSKNLQIVDGSVQQMTRAIVQMEVIRLLNEAKGPIERVNSFSEEIEQRFAKAVENVYFVRSQYDQLLANAMNEYEHKLKTIGEHIYRVYEEDYREFAEHPLTTPTDTHLEFSMDVDERRLAARSAALEANLAALGEEVLEPLLLAQHEFEHALAGVYASRVDQVQGEVAIPAAIRVYQDAAGEEQVDVVASAKVVRDPDGAGGEGLRLRRDRKGDVVATLITGVAPEILDRIGTRALEGEELPALKAALAELARSGQIDQALLQGYYDYLDTFGLEIFVEGEVAGTMNERQDGDRIVITGYSAGSHFPRTQAQTQFRVEADGLSKEGPFHIAGSVYGRELRLRGPGTISGPLLGRGDIALENHGAMPQRLLGGMHASGHVAAKSRGAGLRDSLVGGIDRVDYVVRGDVIAEHLVLENAVVFGNVRARHVKLSQCIVLGQVLAREKAVIAASTLLAYEAPAVRFEGPCCLLFAAGASDRVPEFAPLCDGMGASWDCDVRFHPMLKTAGYAALTNRPWETPGDALAVARLRLIDWVRVDAERDVRKIRDGKVAEARVPVERYVLSVAGRALNFKALADHLDHMKWILKTALEFEHYHPNHQSEVRRRWQASCSPDEAALLDLVTRPAVPEPPRAGPKAPSRPRA